MDLNSSALTIRDTANTRPTTRGLLGVNGGEARRVSPSPLSSLRTFVALGPARPCLNQLGRKSA